MYLELKQCNNRKRKHSSGKKSSYKKKNKKKILRLEFVKEQELKLKELKTQLLPKHIMSSACNRMVVAIFLIWKGLPSAGISRAISLRII